MGKIFGIHGETFKSLDHAFLCLRPEQEFSSALQGAQESDNLIDILQLYPLELKHIRVGAREFSSVANLFRNAGCPVTYNEALDLIVNGVIPEEIFFRDEACPEGINIFGHEFKSLEEMYACAQPSISLAAIILGLSNGNDLEAILAKYKKNFMPVVVNGVKYKAIWDAYEEEAPDITLRSVISNMAMGIPPEEALKYHEQFYDPIIVKGTTYKNLAEAHRKLGVVSSIQSVAQRFSQGMSAEEAMYPNEYLMGPVRIKGDTFESAFSAYAKIGVEHIDIRDFLNEVYGGKTVDKILWDYYDKKVSAEKKIEAKMEVAGNIRTPRKDKAVKTAKESPVRETKKDEAPVIEVKKEEAPIRESKKEKAPVCESKKEKAPILESKKDEAPEYERKYRPVKEGEVEDIKNINAGYEVWPSLILAYNELRPNLPYSVVFDYVKKLAPGDSAVKVLFTDDIDTQSIWIDGVCFEGGLIEVFESRYHNVPYRVFKNRVVKRRLRGGDNMYCLKVDLERDTIFYDQGTVRYSWNKKEGSTRWV